jgi:autotransporter translocation and assembly factor TamB
MKLLKRILRIILYAVGGVLLLLCITAGLTQTQFFRDKLRSFALAELDSLLIAKVSLGEIHGNLVTGFQIDGMAMTLGNDTIVSTSHLDLQYDLFEIPGKTISVQSLVLDRPVVRILRSHDGSWNLSRVARPTGDTTTSRFDWAIMVKHLELRDGVVLIVDSTTLVHPVDPDRPRDALDYDAVELDNFWLALSFSSKKNVHTANVTDLRFDARGTPLHLRAFAGKFQVSPRGAQVKDLRIHTDSSDVRLQASLDGADLLGGVELEKLERCSTMVDLTIEPLNFAEFGRVLTPTAFLNGTIRGHLRASGQFGAIRVSSLALQFGRSEINLNGLVKNLHRPKELALDVAMHESTIDPADPLALMPSFDLPDFRSLGLTHLDVEYTGTPLDFRTTMALTTEAGTIQTDDFALTIGGPRKLRYRGTVAVRGLDLARVLDRPGLASRLNGAIQLDGAGVDLRRIYATMHARLDSSTFRDFAVRNADMQIDARDRKVDGVLQLGISNAEYHLTVALDESTLPLPTFALNGTAAGVNLADFTADEKHSSDLNMMIGLTGHGLTLPTLGGDFHFDVTGSQYGDYPIEDGDVHVVLDQQDSTAKSLTITSPVLDASLTGRFDIANLVRLVRFQVNNAALAVRDNFASFDSAFHLDVDTVALAKLRERLEGDRAPVDCRYEMHVKDLQLVSRVVGKMDFDGMADLAGTLQGDIGGLTSSTKLGVKEFFYGDASGGLLIEGGSVLVEARDIGPNRTYADADVHLATEARRLDISGTELDSASVDVRLKDRHARYLFHGALNKDSRMHMAGEARLRRDTILCTVEGLEASHRDFHWQAEPGARMRIGPDHIAVDGLILRRGGALVRADGVIAEKGALRVKVRGKDLDLGDLDYFLPEPEQPGADHTFSGMMDADMTLAGTLVRPTFSAQVEADSISLRGIPFGLVRGTIGYGNGVLDLAVNADVTNGRVKDGPELTAEGSIPLSRDDGAPVDDQRQFRLNIRSAGTPIAILDPLLPNFNELTGMLECDLTLAGTAERPVYSGELKLSDCQFLFEPNNMYYILNGTFHAAGDRIQVTEATLQNVVADERKNEKGLVHLGGDFALRNFTPGDFNLTVTGQLHVVKEATRKSALEIYGDLFAEIGPGPLKFTGNIDRSLLQGNVFIRNSSLIFPPTQQQVVEESALSVPIIIYDDTSKYGEKSVLTAADRYFGAANAVGGHRRVEDIEGTVSFMDGLRYDLNIDATGGTTDIRMIFNPISSEELVATIDGRFSIREDGRHWLGDLAISRAYYSFYRRFDAEGRITFTGPFLNPELDIRATYKGARAVKDTLSDREERVVVVVNIKGPRQSPRLTMNMTIDEVDYAAYRGLKSNDVQSDAIGFIIYGSFPLTVAERGEMSSEVGNTLTKSVLTGASSLLTGTLSEFLRTQTGIINQVELNWNNTAGMRETADIRLSGQAWNGYWRYGGQILDDPLTYANFSVLYSFGSIFNNPTLRNLMMELESKVERGTFGQTNDLKRTNSARLFYRFSF